ncbi:MAG: aminotransferase class V-fold PLP-dependent enzyme, partial [Myxococcales bacterium]|nr:aminotransferase class V-fold PLP-dependent enzyme [Myxococcales bacterium]
WNGMGGNLVANTLNVSFIGCEAESLLIALDVAGIAASAGSACSAGSLDPSPVLLHAFPDEAIHGSAVRFSLARQTSEQEIERAVAIITECVARLRSRG